jgi:signal transduction histidine kinase
MKPLFSESEDNDALRALGRASLQVVHDLKNQLNGLKLYATFLRKRMERSQRPADELETINKLLAGLDRAAKDVSLIVEYGRPVQVNRQPGTDLEKIMRNVASTLNAENLSASPPVTGGLRGGVIVDVEPTPLIGEFDPVLITDALKYISVGAMKMLRNKADEGSLEIHMKDEARESKRDGVIEWKVPDASDHDPFHSFAGSNEIRLSLAARVIEAHGGSAKCQDDTLCVRLPLD